MISPYETYNHEIGVKLSHVLKDQKRSSSRSIQAISYAAYEKRARRNPEFRLRSGGGSGNSVLLSWHHIPEDWKKQLTKEFGHPQAETNPLSEYFTMSAGARRWFDGFQFECGTGLTPDQINQYTVNASVLDAVCELKNIREISRKMRGTSLRGLWPSLIEDTNQFNDILKQTYGASHTLPKSIKLKKNVKNYEEYSYESIIDGRARNQAAKQVTDLMIQVWKDIYAGQRDYKPDYTEVARRYDAFLAGIIDVVVNDSGELYDPKHKDFNHVSAKTVYNYQSSWEHKVQTHAKRSGNRQVFTQNNIPYHKLEHTEYASTTISVDDRNPPFKNLKGKRIWFYNGIDLGSEAFTVSVYGETKEGIILEFYRQMVRNYSQLGLNLPLELEGELSLNSSYTDSFLANGAMFQNVRIEANNARGKKVEAFYRPLRYALEKKREGWLARPNALLESNQASAHKVPLIPQKEIVSGCLKDLKTWNYTLHPNQDKYPGMCRWEVFLENQNPNLMPYNWPGILSGLGHETRTTMRAGRITLQGKHRVVGQKGEVAIGEDLIKIMKQIEGKEVIVRWLDGNDGDVLKSLVYNLNGSLICELMGDLAYHRSQFERTPQCEINRKLTSAYVATVQRYITNGKNAINNITIIENEPQLPKKEFVMPGLDIEDYKAPSREAEMLPDPENEFETPLKPVSKRLNTSTASRF